VVVRVTRSRSVQRERFRLVVDRCRSMSIWRGPVRRSDMKRRQSNIVEAIEIVADTQRVFGALSEALLGSDDDECVLRDLHRDIEVRFRVDGIGPAGLVLTCTSQQRGTGWVGTRVQIALEATRSGTRVALTHRGVPSHAYETCRDGWLVFLDVVAAIGEEEFAA
jgi:hypothetical protein